MMNTTNQQCERCGNPTEGRRRFCGTPCKVAYHNANRTLQPNVIGNCKVCGKHFSRYVSPGRLASGGATGEYCGRSCKGKALSGEKHHQWNGGRHYDKDGYVYLHRPDHPNANVNGYVFEHRLVMEEVIGRLLSPSEVVHHKNAIRDDNRPENLHLYHSNADHKREDIAFRTRNAKGQLV